MYILFSCSSDLVAKRYRHDFQNTIYNSNKSVLVLEPSVVSYEIDNPQKENYETSKHLKIPVRDAAVLTLNNKGYNGMTIPDKDDVLPKVAMLKNEIERKVDFYIQKVYIKD